MFLSSLSDKISVTLLACSECRAKFTPDLAVSEIFEGPKGSGVPALSTAAEFSVRVLFMSILACQISSIWLLRSPIQQYYAHLRSVLSIHQAALRCA